jgi:hypothetical protein
MAVHPPIIAAFAHSDTVTITIRDMADDSVVVNAAACTEIGVTGFFKYVTSLEKDSKTYLFIMTNGTSAQDCYGVLDPNIDVAAIDSQLSETHGSGDWGGGGDAPTVEEIDAELSTNHGSGLWGGVAGTGAITWTYTLTDAGTPIADVDIWITTDMSGLNVIASGKTDQSGQATFYLDAGTVYVWRQKTGWDFDNPDVEVVS